MQTLEVQPLVGIGPVRLGASRAEVLRVLGPCSNSFMRTPSSSHPVDSWFNGSLQVSYTGNSAMAEFIELSASAEFRVTLLGREVFSTPASLLIAHVREHAEFDASDPELGFSYVFPSLELGLWRPVVEGQEGLFFSTVGIGIRGYYSHGPDA